MQYDTADTAGLLIGKIGQAVQVAKWAALADNKLNVDHRFIRKVVSSPCVLSH